LQGSIVLASHDAPRRSRDPARYWKAITLNKYWIVFVVAIVVKFFLGLVTPFSDDFMTFLTLANGSLSQVAAAGFYAPWLLLMKAITEIWLVLPIAHPPLQEMIGFWYFRPSLSITLLIAMEKAPLLFFDAATALAIRTVVNQLRGPAYANHAMVLWLTNPYVTLAGEMWGHWDIVSAFFLLLACIFFSRRQYFRSGFCLGIGILSKLYPILALPVFLLFLSRKQLRMKLPSFSLGVMVFCIPVFIPILLAGKALGSRSLLDQFSLNVTYLLGYNFELYGTRISLLVIAFALFVFGYLFFWESDPSRIFEGVLCLYLVVFAFSFWKAEYLVELLPFLTIFFISSGGRKLLFIGYMASAMLFVLLDWAFYLTSWGHSLFFIPNYNSFMEHYSQLYLFIRGWPIGSVGTTNTILTGPARSIFVGVSLWYIIWIFARNTDRNILRNLISHMNR
jgi:hypothetical protein